MADGRAAEAVDAVGTANGTRDSLVEAVAAHLASVPGENGAAAGEAAPQDPGHLAAVAVLEVLRASGWVDTAEGEQLRSEVERLRELLDLVVRDHRARMAVAADHWSQQLHWLVPLLRAAHGVAFGSLGAKVQLRTAVQQVPPEVLASAGLRIEDAGPDDNRR